MADQPTTEEDVSRPGVLPLFSETAMPSAKQKGLVVLAVDASGNLKLAAADGTKWFMFAHDTLVS